MKIQKLTFIIRKSVFVNEVIISNRNVKKVEHHFFVPFNSFSGAGIIEHLVTTANARHILIITNNLFRFNHFNATSISYFYHLRMIASCYGLYITSNFTETYRFVLFLQTYVHLFLILYFFQFFSKNLIFYWISKFLFNKSFFSSNKADKLTLL